MVSMLVFKLAVLIILLTMAGNLNVNLVTILLAVGLIILDYLFEEHVDYDALLHEIRRIVREELQRQKEADNLR